MRHWHLPGQEALPVEEGGIIPTRAPVFYVRDNGIGIAAKHYEAIFRIFKRLHGSDEFGGGTGGGPHDCQFEVVILPKLE